MYNDDYKPQPPHVEPDSTRKNRAVATAILAGGIALSGAIGLGLVLMNGSPKEEQVSGDQASQDEVARDLSTSPTSSEPGTVPRVEEAAPSPADQLRDAQAQVDSLQTELDARNAELASLKKEYADHKSQDVAAIERGRQRQSAVQKQIADLRDALKSAQDERDALRSDLKEALAEVDRQVARNHKLEATAVAYKQASSENLWSAFTNNAKVRICDRGTHHRRVDCEEQLDAFFDDNQHASFTSCVNTFQAIPMLWEADGDTVPAHAEHIDARDREKKDDWYVVYCDPTLPEGGIARDITEETPQIFAMAQN